MKLERVKISSLIPDPSNARKHDQKNLDAIKGSLAKFGQQKPIVIDYKNIVIAGNGTLAAAKELGWEEIDIVRTDLKGSELTAYGIADNRTGELAAWDMEALTAHLDALKAEDFDLDSIGFDDSFFNREFDEGSDGNQNDQESPYTSKIKSPIYEPKGDKPRLDDLFDYSKTKELINEIESKNIPKEEKEFLKLAAYRHIVFNYKNIAEYYAHATPETQELMENSAMVIIDFNKAIEKGFVKLTSDLAEAYKNDSPE